MKRIACSVILLMLSLIAVQAQKKTKAKDDYKKTVTVKFAPGGLGIGKITGGVEFNFKRKQSITLFLGVPFDKTRSITYDGKSSDIISSGKSAMVGYRYYFGKKNMSGFYVEPYAKYLKFGAHGFLNAEVNNEPARFDSHFDYEGFGGGIQIGAQFFIAKTVSIDLFLIGPEANSVKFSSVSTDVYDNIPWSLADSQEAEKDIKDNLKDIPYLGDKIDVSVDTNKKTVYTKYSGFLPGFRAGLSVGIRF